MEILSPMRRCCTEGIRKSLPGVAQSTFASDRCRRQKGLRYPGKEIENLVRERWNETLSFQFSRQIKALEGIKSTFVDIV